MELGERVREILEDEIGHWDDCDEDEGCKCVCGIEKSVQAIVKIVRDNYDKEVKLKSLKTIVSELSNSAQFLRVQIQQKEIARLRKGECEHIAQNTLQVGCRLCDLALAEKTADAWVENGKRYKEALEKIALMEDTYCRETARTALGKEEK